LVRIYAQDFISLVLIQEVTFQILGNRLLHFCMILKNCFLESLGSDDVSEAL